MAAIITNARIDSNQSDWNQSDSNRPDSHPPSEFVYPAKAAGLPQFSGVFRGRELTRKDRRLSSGLPLIDNLLDGGIVRGRISEFIGKDGAGKTSLALSFAAQATRLEAAAWIEISDHLDPASLIDAGVEPSRMLWISCRKSKLSPSKKSRNSPYCHPDQIESRSDDGLAFSSKRTAILKAAEWILAVGGFGLIVLDFADTRFIPQSAALRVARAAERSGAALIVLAEHRLCGTFAALSLALRPQRLHFSWTDFLTQLADSPARSGAPRASSNPLTQLADSPARSGAPRASTSVVVFDGITIAARVMRNKLGGSGRAAIWRAAADSLENLYTSHRCHPERNESASVVEGSTRSDSHRDRLSTASLIETPISSHLRAAV